MPADLTLPERLDNSDVRNLYETILAHRFQALQINGKEVRSLGVLAAQILYATAEQWRADGQTFRLASSGALHRDLANLGLLFPELSQECI